MEKDNFAFGKKNYILVAISVLLIIVGFILMSGGSSDDPAAFNPEIFSFVRIKLAPIVAMSGFILMVCAILVNDRKPENEKKTDEK